MELLHSEFARSPDGVAACMTMLGTILDFICFCLLVVFIRTVQQIRIFRFPRVLATLDFVMSENAGDEALFSGLYFLDIRSSKILGINRGRRSE